MNEQILKRNNVKIIGNGTKVLILLHGYGCDQNMWRYITPAFDTEYKLVLIDLVGCGNSDEDAYDYQKYATLDGYVNDLVEVCNALNITEATLVGHSVSANIAVLANVNHPALFNELILVCPSPKFINDGDYNGGFSQSDIDELIETLESNYMGWSKGIAPVIMGNPDRPELANELEESFCRNNPEIAKHFARVTFLCDNRKEFQQVNARTLIMQSKVDNLAAVEVGEYVHQAVRNSQFVILDTTGHCPHLSSPNETILSMKSFLNKA